MRYRIGAGAPKDPVQAIAWFLKAAEQNHVEAQINLGLIYGNGQGVAENFKEAFRWFRLAALQGNAMAQAKLGELYLTGYEENRSGRDLDQAAIWFRKGAEQGDPLAQDRLASLLREGKGMPVDLVQAVGWQKKAAAQGFELGEPSYWFAKHHWDQMDASHDGSYIVKEPWGRSVGDHPKCTT